MAGAKRHYIAGQVWHITHRCQKREYNERKVRKKAYWADRYHATAVETGEHLYNALPKLSGEYGWYRLCLLLKG
jgi:hypothetical protein